YRWRVAQYRRDTSGQERKRAGDDDVSAGGGEVSELVRSPCGAIELCGAPAVTGENGRGASGVRNADVAVSGKLPYPTGTAGTPVFEGVSCGVVAAWFRRGKNATAPE